MRGTNSACERYLFPQCLTRTVHADRCVIGRDPIDLGEVLYGAILKVNDAERFTVFRFYLPEEMVHAKTDLVLHKLDWGVGSVKMLWPLLKDALAGSAGSIVIDDGIPKQAIKPCDRAFVVSKCALFFNSANEGGLQDIFGGRW